MNCLIEIKKRLACLSLNSTSTENFGMSNSSHLSRLVDGEELCVDRISVSSEASDILVEEELASNGMTLRVALVAGKSPISLRVAEGIIKAGV